MPLTFLIARHSWIMGTCMAFIYQFFFAGECSAAGSEGVGIKLYEIGGPLEGPVREPFPTQRGEAPGYPGCIPELIKQAEEERLRNPLPSGSEDSGVEWSPQQQWPQLELYPGSVENWRSYWGKYIPVRSMVDSGSLLKNWKSPDLPGTSGSKAEKYAPPLYWVPRHSLPKITGKFCDPVPVLRFAAKNPAAELDFGELPVGMYVVRVVGAVETKNLGPFRMPMYLAMQINDGNKGEESNYRLRLAFQDEFYSVAEFYFHAPEKRSYKARIWLDEGSEADLLVANMDLHDVLAGTTRHPIKKKMTLTTPAELENIRLKANSKDKRIDDKQGSGDMGKRMERDELIWKSLPPLNVQVGGIYGLQRGYSKAVVFGANGKSLEELNKEYGEWTAVENPEPFDKKLMINSKLSLSYTTEDLAALKPLPDPYPIKDRGAGVATRTTDGSSQQEFTAIADAAAARFNPYFRRLVQNSDQYRETGNVDCGWDAAIQLCRTAWQYPSLDGGQNLGAVVTDPGGFEMDLRCRRRGMVGMVGWGNGFELQQFLTAYDRIFPLIQGNKPLANSIHRFVPWVNTPEDVIQLIDVYMVQIMAKQILRFQVVWDNEPAKIAGPAAVLGNTEVTNPWMEWLFTKGYVYPNPPSGLDNVLVTGNAREGTGYIGSWMYCLSEQAAKPAQTVEAYVRADGNPRFDLTNGKNYPKVHAFTRWACFDTWLAGLHAPRIGDVCGPDKPYGSLFDAMMENAASGWRWTKEAAFAWILKNHTGRKGESDAEWQEIEKAAATQKRAPWLENRSRVLPSWFGVLETGTQHDDPRFRRSVMLRTGLGYGHAHSDTLDMQIAAHGLPMTIDGGQRGGYSKPGDSITRVHNLVEVDGKNWMGHSWVRTLSDVEGVRYMLAEAVPPASHSNVKSYSRQVALVDVDEGSGSRPLKPEEMKPNAAMDKGVVSPNSYVFDVTRISGGKLHTYCFHGPLEDELIVNLLDKQPYDKLPEIEQEYVKIFQDKPIKNYPMMPHRYGGRAPSVLEATWRMAVEIPDVGRGEKEMSPGIWSPENPRKHTKLHLLDQEGAKVLTGWLWCRKWSYGFNNVFSQKRSDTETDVVFPAIIEPYSGKPFIVDRRLLEISDNEKDASRAVAIEIKTTNDRTDLCFADGRPDKIRKVDGHAIAGEFAYVSRDSGGLREVALTGGTQLQAMDVSLQPAMKERVAKVISVDYPSHQFVVDQEWPVGSNLKANALEIGSPEHMTTYMLQEISKEGKGGSRITPLGGADLLMSQIVKVDSAKREVVCTLGLPLIPNTPCPGACRNLVASNMARNKFWRAEYKGRQGQEPEHVFKLDGPVSAEDFDPENRFRLWEYGVGDTVRQATWAGLRRTEPGIFELTANCDLKVGLKGGQMEVSPDGKTWRPLKTKKSDGKILATLSLADLGDRGRVYLKTH